MWKNEFEDERQRNLLWQNKQTNKQHFAVSCCDKELCSLSNKLSFVVSGYVTKRTLSWLA